MTYLVQLACPLRDDPTAIAVARRIARKFSPRPRVKARLSPEARLKALSRRRLGLVRDSSQARDE